MGGTVGPRIVRFFMEAEPHVRYETVRRLADDLAIALHATTVTVSRDFPSDYEGDANVFLEFENPNPQPVNLLKLLPQVVTDEEGEPKPLPTSTALLGLTEDGIPLLARLASEQIGYVLVTGQEDAGKSVLLRAIALSLALTHDAEDLRLICVHPDGKTFAPFAGLPHLIRPPVRDVMEGIEVVSSLTMMLDYRERYEEDAPRVVLLIDDAGILCNNYRGFVENLQILVQRGREVGIHVVVASAPLSLGISAIVEEFPLRLVGKIKTAGEARLATLYGGPDAHLLHSRGDFLAFGADESGLRFQAAYVGGDEIRYEVKEMAGECRSTVIDAEPVIRR
jgi:S-DNA-T family DNA segregation ATPase FtsK/SpoIIIE